MFAEAKEKCQELLRSGQMEPIMHSVMFVKLTSVYHRDVTNITRHLETNKQ